MFIVEIFGLEFFEQSNNCGRTNFGCKKDRIMAVFIFGKKNFVQSGFDLLVLLMVNVF
jgi:hypothetical protein